ncbi:NUDIX hydrolase [Bacillus sp. 1P06AnD]|uniref:NUDIX hydrolase n=1 Tax=Bacillus sp. 1P06AnD TaxID=3132208 RepID=UPI0039A049F0
MIFGKKEHGYNYAARPCAYAVILDEKREKVAVVQNGSGRYFLPGGGIERQETPEQCLIRELLEETGYEIRIDSCIGKAQNYFVNSKGEAILNDALFYLAGLTHKVQEPVEMDHILSWISVEEAHKLFHRHQQWAVKTAIGQE